MALIGAVLGILSYVLSLALPEIFSWYRIKIDNMGVKSGYFLNGFGTLHTVNIPIPVKEMVLLGLIGGILVLVGAVACVGGAFREMKSVAIIGGVFMVLGPFLVVLDMMIGLSAFSETVENISQEKGFALFFGTDSPGAGITINWGL